MSETAIARVDTSVLVPVMYPPLSLDPAIYPIDLRSASEAVWKTVSHAASIEAVLWMATNSNIPKSDRLVGVQPSGIAQMVADLDRAYPEAISILTPVLNDFFAHGPVYNDVRSGGLCAHAAALEYALMVRGRVDRTLQIAACPLPRELYSGHVPSHLIESHWEKFLQYWAEFNSRSEQRLPDIKPLLNAVQRELAVTAKARKIDDPSKLPNGLPAPPVDEPRGLSAAALGTSSFDQPWPEVMTAKDLMIRLNIPEAERGAFRKRLDRIAERIDCTHQIETPRAGGSSKVFHVPTVLKELKIE